MSDTPAGLDEFLGAKAPKDSGGVPSGLDEFIAPELAQEKYGDTVGQLKSAAYGLARGFTLGGSDWLATNSGFSKPEDIKGFQEQNTITSGASEFAGTLLGLAAPEAGALGVLSAPIKVASKVGGAITKAAVPALEGAVGKTVAQALAHGLGSAVEGEFYTAGHAISEHALGDPEALGEKLIGQMGTNAALFGGLGSAFGLGKVAIPAIIEKAGFKTEGVSQLVGKALAKASSIVSGKPYEDIAQLTKGIGTAEGAATRASALEGFAEREVTARELTESLSQQHEAMSRATKEYYQGARAEEITKLMSEVPHDAAFSSAIDEAGRLKASIKEMRAEPELYSSTGRVRQAELISEGLENKIANSKTSEDVYHALNEAKQQVGILSKFQGIATDAERATVNKIKQIGYGLKNHLENPTIYGEAGARQAALNSAYSEYAGAAKDFLKTFGKKLANGEIKVDPGKVNTFLGQIGRPGSDIKQQILSDYLEAAQSLNKQMGESAINAETHVPTDKLMDLFNKTQGIAEGAESDLQAINQLKRLKSFGDSGLVGVAGAAAATHFAGPMGTAAYGVYHALKDPAEMVRILSAVERSTQKVTNAINKGSSAIFKAAEDRPIPRPYGALQFASRDDRNEKHEKIRGHLLDLASDPEKLIDHLSANTDALSLAAPNTSSSAQGVMLRATQFLKEKLPQGGPKAPLGPTYKPSDAELSKWHKYFTAVESPTDSLKSVANGTLVPETMEALSVVYPKLLKEMQIHVTDKMTDAVSKKKVIPYRTKLSLSLFLGSDLVPSLNSVSMLANQNMLATATQSKVAQQQQQMGNANNKSVGNMKKSNRLLTASQASAERQES